MNHKEKTSHPVKAATKAAIYHTIAEEDKSDMAACIAAYQIACSKKKNENLLGKIIPLSPLAE